jgi:hypothetical protein
MPASGSQTIVSPSLLRRAGKRARRDVLRATTSPFNGRRDRPLLVHCTHHKSGTVWFRQVLVETLRPYALQWQPLMSEPIRSSTDVAFGGAGRFDRDQLGDRLFRGAHVIRDPRDLVVSGYMYHLVTDEEWAHKPNPRRRGGLSYQDYLRSIDEADGLMAEIEWVAGRQARHMAEWDYDQAEFLELKYEECMSDERGAFENLFHWFGLNDHAITIGMDAVERLSLKRGGAIRNHARSGASGEWRQRFAPEHIQRFKELTGDLVVRLGYETDPDW